MDFTRKAVSEGAHGGTVHSGKILGCPSKIAWLIKCSHHKGLTQKFDPQVRAITFNNLRFPHHFAWPYTGSPSRLGPATHCAGSKSLLDNLSRFFITSLHPLRAQDQIIVLWIPSPQSNHKTLQTWAQSHLWIEYIAPGFRWGTPYFISTIFLYHLLFNELGDVVVPI